MKWLVLPLALLALGAIALIARESSDDQPSAARETETTVESPGEPVASPRQQIRETLAKWAPLFADAADTEDCLYMSKPVCERFGCERASSGPRQDCTPPSSEFRRSFEDATVQDVVIRGNRAAARFSNGEAVELIHLTGDAYQVGGVWWISQLGGNAGRKLFEAG